MTTHLSTSLRTVTTLALSWMTLTVNAHTSSDKILFDFTSTNNSPAWQIVNDNVMGGVSTSRFEVLTNGGAAFSGVVSLENNGGFAPVRSSPVRLNLGGLDADCMAGWARAQVSRNPRRSTSEFPGLMHAAPLFYGHQPRRA